MSWKQVQLLTERSGTYWRLSAQSTPPRENPFQVKSVNSQTWLPPVFLAWCGFRSRKKRLLKGSHLAPSVNSIPISSPIHSSSMSSVPTHNDLSHSERGRLVRSNRKLQALLGETPQVIEAATRRHLPSTFEVEVETSPPQSEGGSLSASPSLRRRNLPSSTLTLATSDSSRPCLCLQLEPPSAHRHTLSLPSPPLTPSTPLSPTTSITVNIISPPSALREFSPLSRSLSSKDFRRRRVAKLARTLGENIAPELVAEPPQPLLPPTTRLLRRTSSTIGPSSTREHSTLSSGRSSAVLHQNYVADGLPISPRPLKSTTLSRSFTTSVRSPRSGSASTHRRGGSLAFTTTATALDLLAAKEARDAEGAQLEMAVQHLTVELLSGKRRKEKEWSGEWNLEMTAVARQLRSLK
ncbi:hypothetical protein C8R43DRAFT_1032606 [Mycena crocata]|nr:hypothetical protein C8R43DRAFT_1032606 [Mycena crocata]